MSTSMRTVYYLTPWNRLSRSNKISITTFHNARFYISYDHTVNSSKHDAHDVVRDPFTRMYCCCKHQWSALVHLTNKKAKTVLCSVIKHARKWREHEGSVEWTRAVGECFSLLLECSRHFLKCFITEQSRFWLFYLFYNIALLTVVKKQAFNCKKSSFFHSLQARARKVSACQRAQNGVTGYSVHLYSDKARCFNQSERALYRNFIININMFNVFLYRVCINRSMPFFIYSLM